MTGQAFTRAGATTSCGGQEADDARGFFGPSGATRPRSGWPISPKPYDDTGDRGGAAPVLRDDRLAAGLAVLISRGRVVYHRQQSAHLCRLATDVGHAAGA